LTQARCCVAPSDGFESKNNTTVQIKVAVTKDGATYMTSDDGARPPGGLSFFRELAKTMGRSTNVAGQTGRCQPYEL
jgi:hypothetical protein